jgi:DNA-binding IclR family transcriptional regulator
MTLRNKSAFYNRSLERALKILCTFHRDRQALTLSQLSKILKLSKTTVSRLSSTLMKYNFLRCDSGSKQYSLGLKLFELGSIIFASFSIRRAASPHLIRLQSKFGKTTFLGILQDDELVYIDKREDPRNPIRFASQIGTRRPPHFGMLGQILMAYLPDNEVNRLLKKAPLGPFTRRSLTNQIAFRKRLPKIRERGFFVDKEEALEGITGIAAPIRDYTGKVIAGVGVGIISSSLNSTGTKQIVKEVCETAKKISQEMGYLEREDRHGSAMDRPSPRSRDGNRVSNL